MMKIDSLLVVKMIDDKIAAVDRSTMDGLSKAEAKLALMELRNEIRNVEKSHEK